MSRSSGSLQELPARRRSLRDYFLLALKGFCMGSADVVPGVSGGTMAFVLGIYRELLQSIRSFDLHFFRLFLGFRFRHAFSRTKWPFLLALASGILAAVFSLARLLSWLLANYPVLIWAFFFGLILASVLTVSRKVTRLTPALAGWAGLGALGAYLMVGLVPASTPGTPWFLFLSGALAICAMILPGISGAFVLVLLGKYQAVLEAVNARDYLTLALVAAGAVCGLAAFSRLLNWLLERCHDATIAVLAGFMVGSLRKVWPWKRTLAGLSGALADLEKNVLPPWDFQLLGAAILCLAGFAAVWLLDRLAREGTAPSLSGTGQTGRRE